jgi:hypothetical protein
MSTPDPQYGTPGSHLAHEPGAPVPVVQLPPPSLAATVVQYAAASVVALSGAAVAIANMTAAHGPVPLSLVAIGGGFWAAAEIANHESSPAPTAPEPPLTPEDHARRERERIYRMVEQYDGISAAEAESLIRAAGVQRNDTTHSRRDVTDSPAAS